MTMLAVGDRPARIGLRDDRLSDATQRFEGPVFLNANQALVRFTLMQSIRDRARGLRTAGYVSGYRGSPLGGLDQAFGKARADLVSHHVRFEPGLNEDLAATAIFGTQQAGLYEKARYDGVFGVWYGKGPGVDRSGDALKHANLAGTSRHGGVIALAGDDHMCKSSTTAHQSEPLLAACGLPILYPATVDELMLYSAAGIAMSRFSGAWVAVKCLTEIMDSSTSVDLAPEAFDFAAPASFILPPGGLNIRVSDTPLDQERRLHEGKLPAAIAFARHNGLDRITLDGGRRLVIVTAGKSWLDVNTALALLGLTPAHCRELGLSVYKLALTWPIDQEAMRDLAASARELLFVEEKRALIEDQARAALYSLPADRRPVISGKTDTDGAALLAGFGDLDPKTIARAILKRLAAHGIDLPSPESWMLTAPERETASRVPWFCAGCPHSTSTRLPEGSLAGGGIGCHGLAALNDPATTLRYVHMGAEGMNWVGRAPYIESSHIFQNMGDGTFNHSGILAIRAAIAARSNITYKILYNDAVAMTGGQRHEGDLTVSSIAAQLDAMGVRRIAVVFDDEDRIGSLPLPAGTTQHHRDNLDALQREMREIEGVTAIIYDQVCATEKRRRRKRGTMAAADTTVYINELVCEGCGDCGIQSNCVAIQPVETLLGRKRTIDQSQCNVDQSCVKGFCPSFVTVTGGKKKSPASLPISVKALPLPRTLAGDRPFAMLITGIGGTGVVTLAAILGMAAHLDGKDCRITDQTGMAQKNGGVVSHVQIGSMESQPLAARVGPGRADLLLGCDIMGAASADVLKLTDPARTRAIISTHVVPTGQFARDRDQPLDAGRHLERIAARIGETKVDAFDPLHLPGQPEFAPAQGNMVMLGLAFQKGLLPISLEAIEQAIRLNGTAVDSNLAAFTLGRAQADAPTQTPLPAPTIDQTIASLRAHLAAYQNDSYARRFDTFVQEVSAAETRFRGAPGILTLAAAQSLAKLMAYKDEYEVARLLTDRQQLARIRAAHSDGARLRFHLAPPLLARLDPRTGRPAKISFGSWIIPALHVLAAMKSLRGTPFDPFGYTQERRDERDDIDVYRAAVLAALPKLDETTLPGILELARQPQEVRGFGPVKAAAREAARTRLASIQADLDRHVPSHSSPHSFA